MRGYGVAEEDEKEKSSRFSSSHTTCGPSYALLKEEKAKARGSAKLSVYVRHEGYAEQRPKQARRQQGLLKEESDRSTLHYRFIPPLSQ